MVLGAAEASRVAWLAVAASGAGAAEANPCFTWLTVTGLRESKKCMQRGWWRSGEVGFG